MSMDIENASLFFFKLDLSPPSAALEGTLFDSKDCSTRWRERLRTKNWCSAIRSALSAKQTKQNSHEFTHKQSISRYLMVSHGICEEASRRTYPCDAGDCTSNGTAAAGPSTLRGSGHGSSGSRSNWKQLRLLREESIWRSRFKRFMFHFHFP